jgi:SnoaL-like protein
MDAEIEQVLQEVETATTRFVMGDAEPFKALWSHEADVSIMGGWGAYEVGWTEVGPRLEWAAARYKSGTWSYELLTAGHSGEQLYTAGIERSEALLEGQEAAGRSELRVTHIFRREDGRWRIVHRHADPILSKTEAAAVLQG